MNSSLRHCTAILVTIGTALASCSAGDDSSNTSTSDSAGLQPEPTAVAQPAPADGQATTGGAPGLALSGQTLDLMVLEAETGVPALLDAFAAATGVAYEIRTATPLGPGVQAAIDAGDPPDIALLATPGDIAAFARAGDALELTDPDLGITDDELSLLFSETALALGEVDGRRHGLLASSHSKSTVWYRPAAFESLGVAPPATLDEWQAVIATQIDAGRTPFSLGNLEGFPLTDWFENIYLRTAGPERYRDLFVRETVPWTDPTVVNAIEILRDLLTPLDERVTADAATINDTSFIPAFDSIIDGDAEMYFEGGFMVALGGGRHPDLVAGTDYTYFPFPAIDPEYAESMMLGGVFAVPFTATEATAEFLRFLGTAEAAATWASDPQGARIIPNLNADPNALAIETMRSELDDIVEAETIVFDGSDLASPAVAEAMFAAFQDFLLNPDDIDAVINQIATAALND